MGVAAVFGECLAKGACMHPLLINAENDHRRRTLEPFATDRKLTALERQRTNVKGSQSSIASEGLQTSMR
jgi:hypothetical protein